MVASEHDLDLGKFLLSTPVQQYLFNLRQIFLFDAKDTAFISCFTDFFSLHDLAFELKEYLLSNGPSNVHLLSDDPILYHLFASTE
jgi:hypothetical protein